MAATDQTYRNQTTLDVIFGVSCGALLLTTLWMFIADYNRPFKEVQRTFRDVESALAEREMIGKMPDVSAVAERRDALQKARERVERVPDYLISKDGYRLVPVKGSEGTYNAFDADGNLVAEGVKPDGARTVAEWADELKARRERDDDAYRGFKAEYDSRMSYYNIAIDEAAEAQEDKRALLQKGAEASDKELPEFQKQLAPGDYSRLLALRGRKKELDELQSEVEKALKARDETDRELQGKVHNWYRGPSDAVAEKEASLKDLTKDFDRWAKTAAVRTWSFGDTFRNLPIIDAFAAPTRINQVWLPDLTIDYSFKEVPRYDRCTTCHLGIDRVTFDRANLEALVDPEKSATLNGKLRAAQKIIQERIAAGEKLEFSPNDFPGERRGSVATVSWIMFLCVLVAAGTLGLLARSWRLGLQTLLLGAVLTGVTGVALAAFAPHVSVVKSVPLTEGQITEFKSHPRLDLFVDANSPHPVEKFGCTICHAGQGSATDFQLASHTPDDVPKMEKWEKEHNWGASHFWDFPMYPRRFVESSCVKCHHQMTDLIRQGNKEEAPKLLRGYNLVKELGCFGCHEISGIKGNRTIGPDIRLESTPALEFLSAAEQERAKADPANPPGTMRKVGPSLRRLAEKTNQEWTRQWIQAPRGFRPDTRMPHFYGLSNNSEEMLPADQKSYPAAEIHAISYYLLTESKEFLKGDDAYRRALLKGNRNLSELQDELKKGALSDKDMKDLLDVSRRFSNLALLSAPLRATAINADATRQHQLQERLQELQKKKGEKSEADRAEIAAAGKELDAVTARLIEDARPVPIATRLLNNEAEPVSLPEGKGDAARGRQLFTERGCLACHSHEGTSKPEGGIAAVVGEATHGPELSRIAAKIRPELGAEQARRWLVQWIMNPNVHHPRTRMPVTFLDVNQANDVAEWLLSHSDKDWKGHDPEKPDADALKSLARTYLRKAPRITAHQVDEFLPEKKEAPGIPASWLRDLPRDADEHMLAQEFAPEDKEKKEPLPVSEDKLKWYIGRKAIGRLGCYGCHDIPGFETAKPIGTGLNDWGRKDPERLAYEDGANWVREHFHIVSARRTRPQLESRKKELEGRLQTERTPALEQRDREELDEVKKALETGDVWESKDGKPPYERYFFDTLEHGHQKREAFLNLKLIEPRSYDFDRIKAWDDRLRMPQFRFTRSRQKAGESDEDYAVRQTQEEADAREAVMTFILGLVAEPIPLKYVAQPTGDKLAEARGRQVLDKYNCAGCHQIQPGQYEFRQNDDTQKMLLAAYNVAAGNRPAEGVVDNPSFKNDHPFLGHNAWFGTLSSGDRGVMVGIKDPKTTEDPLSEEEEGKKPRVLAVRLTEALRFADPDRVVHDAPAGVNMWVPQGSVIRETPPFGGVLIELLMSPDARVNNEKGYLASRYPSRFDGKPDDQRGALPPPLLREGERVQPDWLYRFLLNPKPIRPQGYVLLRMPRFNMSPEESRALVNYFAGMARATNPGAGVTYPYLTVTQKDPDFWQRQTEEYVRRLKGTDKGSAYEGRLKALKPMWVEVAKKELSDAESALPALEKVEKEAREKKAPELEARAKAVKDARERIEALKEEVKKGESPARQKHWESQGAYAQDAFRLLTSKELCLKCHNIGNLHSEAPQGPDLMLAAERLRPEWTEWWIANPIRMFPYSPVMPQNFPNETPYVKYQELFVGSGLQQVRAARDVLMDLPRLSQMPGIREQSAGTGGPK